MDDPAPLPLPRRLAAPRSKARGAMRIRLRRAWVDAAAEQGVDLVVMDGPATVQDGPPLARSRPLIVLDLETVSPPPCSSARDVQP